MLDHSFRPIAASVVALESRFPDHGGRQTRPEVYERLSVVAIGHASEAVLCWWHKWVALTTEGTKSLAKMVF
jgi:hypothetical protein